MTKEEMESLKTGDIIRHKSANSTPLIVSGNYGSHLTAVQTHDVTNPSEWEVVLKASYKTHLNPNTPDGPGEVVVYCTKCGMENQEDD